MMAPDGVSGYGHSTPQTAGGKVFCMFYALAGIPLNLVMFQSIGERLNAVTTFLLGVVLRAFRRCVRSDRRRTTNDELARVNPTQLIVVSLTVSALVVAGGAWAFTRCEGWTYLDSIYYCIVTLTTVCCKVSHLSPCGRPNRPHYVSCPSVRPSVLPVRVPDLKTKKVKSKVRLYYSAL